MAPCARRSGKKEYEPQSVEDRQYCDCSLPDMGRGSIFTRACGKAGNLSCRRHKSLALGQASVLALAMCRRRVHIARIAGLTRS